MIFPFQFRIEFFIADCTMVKIGCCHFGPSAHNLVSDGKGLEKIKQKLWLKTLTTDFEILI